MIRYAIVAVLPLVSVAALAEESMLRCQYEGGIVQHFRFDPESAEAKLIIGDSVREARVVVSDTHYRFVIPATGKTYEARVTVNRFSGEAFYEFGDPPFNEHNPRNKTWYGKCTKVSIKPSL